VDVVDDVALGDVGAVGLQRDVGTRDLSRLVTRDGDHNHIFHHRHGVDDRLELSRSNLEAFVLDQLLAAVSNEEEALLIEFGDVTGVHEAIGTNGLLSGVLVVEVALHDLSSGEVAKGGRKRIEDLRSTKKQLSLLSWMELIPGHRVDDEGLGIRDQQARGSLEESETRVAQEE
jgi:hypothetical protein